MIVFSRSSNCPRYFVPATIRLRSSASTRLSARKLGTSPSAIFCASPSTIAVLPTPGSPISTGLFFIAAGTESLDHALHFGHRVLPAGSSCWSIARSASGHSSGRQHTLLAALALAALLVGAFSWASSAYGSSRIAGSGSPRSVGDLRHPVLPLRAAKSQQQMFRALYVYAKAAPLPRPRRQAPSALVRERQVDRRRYLLSNRRMSSICFHHRFHRRSCDRESGSSAPCPPATTRAAGARSRSIRRPELTASYRAKKITRRAFLPYSVRTCSPFKPATAPACSARCSTIHPARPCACRSPEPFRASPKFVSGVQDAHSSPRD